MQKKKGISLIVLVITIIVMTILAGAIILTLNNSGVIENASDAVKMSNLATAKNVADLAWAEAYADGVRTVEDLGTAKGFKSIVNEALVKSGLGEEILNDYVVHVTTNGVSVVVGWKQEGLTVRREEQVLTIGDDIEYDETAGETIQDLTNVKWKVLGASDRGELLIMSATDIVVDYRLGYEDTMTDNALKLKECQHDWLTAVEQLDNLCKPYGKGKSSTGARSIRIEDVDKITGYDKTKFGSGELWAYANEVTYSYNGTTKPLSVAANGKNGNLTVEHTNGFYYYNGTDFSLADSDDLKTSTGIITKMKNNLYYYYSKDLDTRVTESKAYEMIFGKDNAENVLYWLANNLTSADTDCVPYGVSGVKNGAVLYKILLESNGNTKFLECGVRAVVSLAHDIQITGDSTSGWTY